MGTPLRQWAMRSSGPLADRISTVHWRGRSNGSRRALAMTDLPTLLKTIPAFADLNDSALGELSSRCQRMTYNKNAILMTEGESGERLLIIESGSAKVFVSDDDGNEMMLYLKGPGSYIGDIALLDDAPRSASAVTLSKTVAHCMSKSDFLSILRLNPEIPITIIRSLTRRLRHETEVVRSLALDNVYRRLVSKLMELSESDDAGCRMMPGKFSHQQISTMIGSSREMVSKILAELIKGEYVEMRDGVICIVKKLPKDW